MATLIARLARIAAVTAVASSAPAQVPESPPKALCFTPDVAAHCTRFVLLEGNMAYRKYPSGQSTYATANVVSGSRSWGLGAMQNVNAHTALGAAVAYGFNGSRGSRTTVELRAIRWLPGRLALEGSAG